MRNLIPAFILILLVSSCKTCDPEQVAIVHESLFQQTFPDGTKVEKQEIQKGDVGRFYYVRKGHTQNKDCRISRTEIQKDGELFLMRMAGATETCSGKNCSHCAFKTGGGCECKNSLNTCEHTITRNRDMIRLR